MLSNIYSLCPEILVIKMNKKDVSRCILVLDTSLFVYFDDTSIFGRREYYISFIRALVFILNFSNPFAQYRWIAYTAISIGCCFVVAFLIGTKEPG